MDTAKWLSTSAAAYTPPLIEVTMHNFYRALVSAISALSFALIASGNAAAATSTASNGSAIGAAFIAQPFPGESAEGGQIDLVGIGTTTPTVSLDTIPSGFRIFSGPSVWMSANGAGITSTGLVLTGSASISGSVRARNASSIGSAFTALPFSTTDTAEGGDICLAGATGKPDICLDNLSGILRVYSGGLEWLRMSAAAINLGITGAPIIIGTDPGGTGKLRVNGGADIKGTIRAMEVVVISPWADYVFAPDYALMPLSDVRDYVTRHQHLPEVPDSATIKRDGLPVAEMQRIHMAKIEELTLYAIEADRRYTEANLQLHAAENDIAGMKKEHTALLERLSTLEAVVDRLSKQK